MLGCVDDSRLGPGAILAIVLLAGRIAAMVGICMRNTTGWWLAVSFFVLIVILSGIAAAIGDNPIAMVSAIFPLLCILYLAHIRSEFD